MDTRGHADKMVFDNSYIYGYSHRGGDMNLVHVGFYAIGTRNTALHYNARRGTAQLCADYPSFKSIISRLCGVRRNLPHQPIFTPTEFEFR